MKKKIEKINYPSFYEDAVTKSGANNGQHFEISTQKRVIALEK